MSSEKLPDLVLLLLLVHLRGVAGINVSSINLLSWYFEKRREMHQSAPQTVFNEWRVKGWYKLRHLINNGAHSLPSSYDGQCTTSLLPSLDSFCTKQPHILFQSNHTLLNLILCICTCFSSPSESSLSSSLHHLPQSQNQGITCAVTDQYLIYPESKWCSTHPVTSERFHQPCNQSLSLSPVIWKADYYNRLDWLPQIFRSNNMTIFLSSFETGWHGLLEAILPLGFSSHGGSEDDAIRVALASSDLFCCINWTPVYRAVNLWVTEWTCRARWVDCDVIITTCYTLSRRV